MATQLKPEQLYSGAFKPVFLKGRDKVVSTESFRPTQNDSLSSIHYPPGSLSEKRKLLETYAEDSEDGSNSPLKKQNNSINNNNHSIFQTSNTSTLVSSQDESKIENSLSIFLGETSTLLCELGGEEKELLVKYKKKIDQLEERLEREKHSGRLQLLQHEMIEKDLQIQLEHNEMLLKNERDKNKKHYDDLKSLKAKISELEQEKRDLEKTSTSPTVQNHLENLKETQEPQAPVTPITPVQQLQEKKHQETPPETVVLAKPDSEYLLENIKLRQEIQTLKQEIFFLEGKLKQSLKSEKPVSEIKLLQDENKQLWSQLQSLKKECEEARKMKTQLKNIELLNEQLSATKGLTQKYQSLVNDYTKLEHEYKDFQDLHKEWKPLFDQYSSVKELILFIEDRNKKIEVLEDTHLKGETELRRKQAEIDSLKVEISTRAEENKSLEKSLLDCKERLTLISSELSHFTRENQTLKEKLKEFHNQDK